MENENENKENKEDLFSSFLFKLKDTQSQMDKFEFLSEFIEKKVEVKPLLLKFNSTVWSSAQDVFEFFANRTKWKKIHDLVVNFQNQTESIILENNNETKDLEVSFN